MAEGLDTCHTEITFSLPEFVWYGSPGLDLIDCGLSTGEYAISVFVIYL